jgi:hypothetical protein
MASPSNEQRIKRELSRRGTCSLLDLKSTLKLSRGDIEANTDRLGERGFVRIEKDHRGKHTSYTWTGPKEEVKPADNARPKKAKGKRTASPEIPSRAARGGGMMRRTNSPPLDWEQLVKDVKEHIRLYACYPAGDEMLRLLQNKKNVESAANILWTRVEKLPAEKRSELRRKFHILIANSLWSLVPGRGILPPPRRASELRQIVKVLETVRDDNLCFREGGTCAIPDGTLYVVGREAREELQRAISIYRMMIKDAPKTKPKDLRALFAFGELRASFKQVFGNPMSKVVGLLMGWSPNTVRARASEGERINRTVRARVSEWERINHTYSH